MIYNNINMRSIIILQLLSTFALAVEYINDEFSIDLNLDQKNEIIQLKKKNGLDYLAILSSDQKLLFEHELIPMGKNSKLKKISHIKINDQHQCLLGHYFEGQTKVQAPKRSSRLYSFCFLVSNLRKIYVQDLGYIHWDYQSVAGFQTLESLLTYKNHIFQNYPSVLMTLKQNERIRSWQFDSRLGQWINLPERMFAEYAVKPAR